MEPRNKVWNVIAVLAAVLGAIGLIVGTAAYTYAVGTSLTITSNVVVPSFCGFTAGVSNLDFKTMSAGTNTLTMTNSIVFTNTGNTNTNVLVQLTSSTGYVGWNGVTTPTQGFAASNTEWSKSAATAWLSGTAMTGSGVDTGLVMIATGGTTNTLYFGQAIPLYQGAQTYNTILTTTSSC